MRAPDRQGIDCIRETFRRSDGCGARPKPSRTAGKRALDAQSKGENLTVTEQTFYSDAGLRAHCTRLGVSVDSDDSSPTLSGSIRLPRSLMPGTRTEKLPFPCHPLRHYAFLAEFDPPTPVQYWEQTCAADWTCDRTYRFEHRNRELHWYPITGLTDRLNPPAKPLDPFAVAARLLRERGVA